ncbi:MAG: cytochrome c oxidase assembly protein [Myxococcota bacterium]|nr:cytochrome c oxidase assembly protein [Myxococcota bacterium]
MNAWLWTGAGWTFAPLLVLPGLAAGWLYLRGFRKLRQQSPQHFQPWRRNVFLLGLALIFVALGSPLDGTADLLLLAHMVQHWLLIMVVPPLIWLGAPVVPLLRGLPGDLLGDGVGPLLASPRLRRVLSVLTHPVLALGIFTGVTWAWHAPAAYQWALVSRAAHDFEHASFLAAALLLWYCILEPWPVRRPRPFTTRLLLVAGAGLVNSIFSAGFAFSGTVFYPLYAQVANPWLIPALADQNTAGAFMWIGGSLAMIAAAVGLTLSGLASTASRRQLFAPGRNRVQRPAPRAKSTLARVLTRRRTRRIGQWILASLAGIVILDGLLGPEMPSSLNLAGVLPWTYGRSLSLILLLSWGNFFCGICPLTLSRRLAGRLLGRPFRWPARLQNKWISAALFIAYLWSYEVLGLWDWPAATAVWILGLFGLFFVVEGFFPRGTFCRYVCPVGQFQFVQATLSPREVAPLSLANCAGCKTRDCLLGNAEEPGCPTDLYLPAKTGNLDCTFCMDCARACPRDNVGVISVRPGASLGRGRARGQGWSLDLTVLAGLFIWGAFVNAMAMSAPFVHAQAGLAGGLGWAHSAGFASAVLGVALLGPPLIFTAAAAGLGRVLGGSRLSALAGLRALLPGLVPLGFAMWLAHLGFHLLTGLFSALPALERALHDLAPNIFSRPEIGMPYTLGWTADLQLTILGFGLVVSIAVLWRLSREVAASPGRALALAAPWSLLATGLWGLGAFIFLSPMAMRGMMG